MLCVNSGFAQNPDKAFIQAIGGDYVPRPRLYRDQIYAATVVIDGVTITGTQASTLTDSDGSVDDADGEHTHAAFGGAQLTIVGSQAIWPAADDTVTLTLDYSAYSPIDIWVGGWNIPRSAQAPVANASGDITSVVLARRPELTARNNRDETIWFDYITTDVVSVLADDLGNFIVDEAGYYILVGD